MFREQANLLVSMRNLKTVGFITLIWILLSIFHYSGTNTRCEGSALNLFYVDTTFKSMWWHWHGHICVISTGTVEVWWRQQNKGGGKLFKSWAIYAMLFTQHRMNNNDKRGAIKISWENFTSYCSSGTIFVVDNSHPEILAHRQKKISE